MARGYSGKDPNTCRCCRSGPKQKFWCEACDNVKKGTYDGTPICQFCREPMTAMGHRWRPGKKGSRGRTRRSSHVLTSRRYREWLSPQEWIKRGNYREPSPGEVLLKKLTG